MRRLIESFNAWARTLPPPMNALMVLFGIEVAILAVFFAFAFLVFILWVVLHPVIWPNG